MARDQVLLTEPLLAFMRPRGKVRTQVRTFLERYIALLVAGKVRLARRFNAAEMRLVRRLVGHCAFGASVADGQQLADLLQGFAHEAQLSTRITQNLCSKLRECDLGEILALMDYFEIEEQEVLENDRNDSTQQGE